MKCIYIVILLIIPTFIFSQAIERRPQYEPRKDNHKNASDVKGKQGLWKEFTRNRELISETNYENDIKNGPCIKYYIETGGPKEELNYYWGVKDGDYKSYYFDGNVKSEGFYKKDRRDEHWIFYHRGSGEKSAEGDYKLGKKTGEWVYYTRKGELFCKGNFINDVQDGTWTYYDTEGKVSKTMKYVKGAPFNEESTAKNEGGAKGAGAKKGNKNPPMNNTKSQITNNNQTQKPLKAAPKVEQDVTKSKTGQGNNLDQKAKNEANVKAIINKNKQEAQEAKQQAQANQTPSPKVVPKIQIDSGKTSKTK